MTSRKQGDPLGAGLGSSVILRKGSSPSPSICLYVSNVQTVRENLNSEEVSRDTCLQSAEPHPLLSRSLFKYGRLFSLLLTSTDYPPPAKRCSEILSSVTYFTNEKSKVLRLKDLLKAS